MKQLSSSHFSLCRLPLPALLLMALSTAVPRSTHAQSRIDNPTGGWRASASTQRDFVQEVNYPAASVNVKGRDATAMIQGRIAEAAKAAPETEGEARRPGRLVVDGVALPLHIEEGGRYARPWSFGAGPHGVEVRPSQAGGSPRRVQFYEANRDRAGVGLRVVLSWDSDNTDLDLHVISPDGEHVFYGNRVSRNGGALDVDVTTGFGPEIYAHPMPPAGVWQVWVNYFGSGEQRNALTVAQVAVIEHEGTPREKQQVFRMPMRKPSELTLVRSFTVQ